jgi:tetratricopeptide (TPR) repeat protein
VNGGAPLEGGGGAPGRPRGGRRRISPSLLLFFLAIGLRLLYLYDLKDYEFLDRLQLDPLAYDLKAKAIGEGESPAPGRPYYQSPLYAYFLAGVYALSGESQAAARLVQVVLGGIAVVLLARLGASLFGRNAGWVAGLAAALYAPFPFYEAQIMKTSLGVFLALAGTWLLLRRDSRASALGAGFLIGCAALVRENDLLFLFLAAVSVAWGVEAGKGSLRRALLVLLGGGIALAPVAVRNRVVSGEWILITSQGGQNFYIGNNELARGTYTELPFVRPDPRYEEEDFRAEAARRLGRDPSAAEVSRYWYGEAFRWMRGAPGEALALLLRKAGAFWNRLELPDNENFYYMRDRFFSLRLFPVTFGWVALFGIVGMIACLPRFRSLFLLYAGVGGTFAGLTAFFVVSRYRLPAVPFLILFAAEGARVALASLRERRPARSAALAGAFVLSGALVFLARPIDFDPRTDGYLPLHVNRAMLFAEAGERGPAIEEYRAALRLAPDRPSIRKRLALLLLEEGRKEEARRELEAALPGLPRDAGIRNDLAILFLEQGERAKALALLEEAASLDPGLEGPHRNLGRLYLEMGRAEDGARETARADSLRAARGGNR